MNANLIQGNNNDHESDSDNDVSPEYYQPISSVADDDDDSDEEQQQRNAVENGISAVELNGDVEEDEDEDEDEDDEEEREREASDSATLRAFREDDTRRNAPLTPENANRVIEAMRGVSFSGSVPDWAGRVSEDQWIHQLRTLRQQQISPN